MSKIIWEWWKTFDNKCSKVNQPISKQVLYRWKNQEVLCGNTRLDCTPKLKQISSVIPEKNMTKKLFGKKGRTEGWWSKTVYLPLPLLRNGLLKILFYLLTVRLKVSGVPFSIQYSGMMHSGQPPTRSFLSFPSLVVTDISSFLMRFSAAKKNFFLKHPLL